MRNLETLTEETLNYYKQKEIALPTTVTAYIKDFAPGCSRQMIKKYTGMTCGKFLLHIGAAYIEIIPAYIRLLEACERLDFIPLNVDSTFRAKDRLDVQCKLCGYINNTTLDSMRGTILGCRKCKSGNLAWVDRSLELKNLIDSELNGTLVSVVPENQTGYIKIKCNECATVYQTQLVGVVSPNSSLRATCPNCRDTDKRVVIGGITFGSRFEADCYKILKPLHPELHTLYKTHLPTDRRWVCDFKIGTHWVEVSNFKANYKNYFGNIKEKQQLVESNAQKFFFLRSLDEVAAYISQEHNI